MKDKTIVVIALCLLFLVNSTLITIKYTRRSADELVKINQSENKEQIACLEGNGNWTTGVGAYYFCQPKK